MVQRALLCYTDIVQLTEGNAIVAVCELVGPLVNHLNNCWWFTVRMRTEAHCFLILYHSYFNHKRIFLSGSP